MDILFLIGRILYGGFFLMSAFNHFTQAGAMAPYAGSKGVPSPTLSVYVSGLLLLIGGASILLGLYPLVGVAALVLFLIPTSLMMHNFWAIEDPQQQQAEMIQFMKNIALLGAALMFLMIETPWPFSLSF